MPPDQVGVHQYYKHKVNVLYQELSAHSADHPDFAKEAGQSMKELDADFKKLKEDLNDDISNKEILDAMIQNYRLKLDILERMMKQLENIEETNEEKHHVTNI